MSASSFVKSKFGKEAYRQRSYQNSKLRHGASNREETSDGLSGLLTGSDPEEYRIWHDVFLNGELNKEGLQDFYDRPGAPAIPRPTEDSYACRTAKSAQARAQEVRAMQKAQKDWDDNRAKTFQLIVDSIVPGSNAYNLVADIIKKDVKGNCLEEMMRELNNYFNSCTQAGLFDLLFMIFNLPNSIDLDKKNNLTFLVPHIFNQIQRLESFVIREEDDDSEAVTCKLPEPVAVLLSFIIPVLMGNTDVILNFFNREFRQKDRDFQADLSKLSWASIFPLFKGYLQSVAQETAILSSQSSSTVSMSANATNFSGKTSKSGKYKHGGGGGHEKDKRDKNKQRPRGGGCVIHGPGSSHSTEECFKIKDLKESLGNSSNSGGNNSKNKNQRPDFSEKSGNSNRYQESHQKKGKYAHQNSAISPFNPNSSSNNVSADSTEIFYTRDEDTGEFFKVDANSAGAVVGRGGGSSCQSVFDPRYFSDHSVWSMGTQFSIECDEDGHPIAAESAVPTMSEGAFFPVEIGSEKREFHSQYCDEDGNPLDSMPVVTINTTTAWSGKIVPEKYAVYCDSCASHSVLKYAEMFIPGSLVPCVGAITGSTTTMQIPIVARGLVSLMGRKIGAFFAPKITKNLISEGRLCTNYSFRIEKQGTEIILTDLTSSGSSNTAVFSIEGGTGLYRIPSYLLM